MKRLVLVLLATGLSQSLPGQAVDSLVVRGSRWRAIGPATVAFGILAGVWMLSPPRN